MSMINPWHPSEQQLKFQIGDLTLGSRRLPVLACEMGPDAQPTDLDIPPGKALEDGMIGYVMRSVPIAATRPLVETKSGYCVYTPHHFERYFVDLQHSFEDYVQSFRAKTRSTMRRKVKKFAEFSGGETDFRVYRTEQEIPEFYAAARQVSEITYQENLLDAGLPKGEEYLQHLQDAAKHDGVRGYMLFHEGKPISYLLLRAAQNTLVYDYLGFDPAYAKWSIGTVLHWLALESIFDERRYRMLDFTEGEGQQKQQFATGSVTCATIYCLKNSPGIYLSVRLHILTNKASNVAGTLLSKLGLRSKIRKLIRSFKSA